MQKFEEKKLEEKKQKKAPPVFSLLSESILLETKKIEEQGRKNYEKSVKIELESIKKKKKKKNAKKESKKKESKKNKD
jgi:hypothetical protein